MATLAKQFKRSAKPTFRKESKVSLSRAPAVNRAIDIMRALTHAVAPMSVNGIARALGIVPSTCLHILRALEEEGFVRADPVDKRYSIGLGLVSLARESLNSGIPTRVLKQALDDIAVSFGTTCVATQIDKDDRMVIVAVSRGGGTFGIHFDIGRHFPAYISATGRCLAAHSRMPKAGLKRKFDSLVWDVAPKFEEWLAQVEVARREGVGIDRGQYVRGFTIVAVPVLEDGQMTRSLVSISTNDHLKPQQIDALKEHMRGAASRLMAGI